MVQTTDPSKPVKKLYVQKALATQYVPDLHFPSSSFFFFKKGGGRID